MPVFYSECIQLISWQKVCALVYYLMESRTYGLTTYIESSKVHKHKAEFLYHSDFPHLLDSKFYTECDKVL